MDRRTFMLLTGARTHRVLAKIRRLYVFATSEPDVLVDLPRDESLVAVVSGYQSWSACNIASAQLTETSYGAIGLTRAGHGTERRLEPGVRLKTRD